MERDEIKSAVLKCEGEIDDSEKDMENDLTLKQAKEDVKLLSSGYKGTIMGERAKIKYLLHVSKLRGYA